MAREYRVLSHLSEAYERAPHAFAYCDDDSVLGAPFYLMERVEGVILRREPPSALDLGPAVMRRLSENFVDALVELHRVDYQAAGLGELGRPQGYVERQITGWKQRYEKAHTEDIPEMDKLSTWLTRHRPPESGAALIHNDFKYDNLVLDPYEPPEIKAVLDWEMATIGDPLLDLGTSLGYWVNPDDPDELQAVRFAPTTLPGNLTRGKLVERYGEWSGRDTSNILFHYVCGLYKIAVIVQQIHARYLQGDTHDERFAHLDRVVHVLARMASRAIETGQLDRLRL